MSLSVARATGQLRLTSVLKVVVGIGLLTLSAKTEIPFWPVPMTLQTLVVVLLPFLVGPQAAIGSVAGYLAVGAAGLPVFAGAVAGPAYMVGPTGGYLAGFLLAALLIGALYRRIASRLVLKALTIVAAVAVMYACGLLWLSTFVGVGKVLALGLLPFLPAEALKIALAVTGAALKRGA